jgi:addiction module antitoxin, RelB/DinJ family
MSTIVRSRIDDAEVQTAEAILGELGLNMAEYLRIAIKQLNNQRAIPFDMVITNPVTLQAIDDMNNHRDVLDFDSFEALKTHFTGKQ